MSGLRTLDRPHDLHPGDHVVWAVDGADDLSVALGEFLVEGALRGERMFYVCEPRDAGAVDGLSDLALWLAAGQLHVQDVGDVYQLAATGNPWSQVRKFAHEVQDAKHHGFSGIRVWADVTSLTVDSDVRQRLLDYETAVGSLFRHRSATGVCAVDVDESSEPWTTLTARHPLRRTWPEACEFVVEVDGGIVFLTGELDLGTLPELTSALATAAHTTLGPLVIDLSRARFIDANGARAIARFVLSLHTTGRRAVVRGVARGSVEVLAAFGLVAEDPT
ncbi:MAG TPA: MEDS domain-containing protein [Angustibacter sp.]|nr:MEDS domain-containing protein [Angustibacter sp.]